MIAELVQDGGEEIHRLAVAGGTGAPVGFHRAQGFKVCSGFIEQGIHLERNLQRGLSFLVWQEYT